MKRQVRLGVFETNSSSTHSLTLCTAQEYKDFQEGKCGLLTWDREYKKLSGLDSAPTMVYKTDPLFEKCSDAIEMFEEYESKSEYYEEFSKTLKIGDVEVIAFGYYGYES